jgi:hypothetical protein
MRHLRFLAALLLIGLCAAEAAGTVPNTLDEAFASLDASLTPDQRLAFMERPEREAISEAHFGIGLFIRNQWLRSGKSALTGELHQLGAVSFDDMSSMILASYWRHLHGKPIELEQQGACYKRWSLAQQILINEAKAHGSSSYSTPNFDCPPES